MMNHLSLRKGLLFAAVACIAISCGEKKSPTDIKGNNLPKASAKEQRTIAFVEIDTLMNQYQFCKDNMLLITKRSETYKRQLNNKSQALQQAIADFQQKMQQGQLTQQQAEQKQASLQKMQAELQELQERLSVQFDEEQQQYNNRLRDSIKLFLKAYNKDKGYSMIISKAGDNVLLADPSLDITKDVVDGLNKRYKSNKKQ